MAGVKAETKAPRFSAGRCGATPAEHRKPSTVRRFRKVDAPWFRPRLGQDCSARDGVARCVPRRCHDLRRRVSDGIRVPWCAGRREDTSGRRACSDQLKFSGRCVTSWRDLLQTKPSQAGASKRELSMADQGAAAAVRGGDAGVAAAAARGGLRGSFSSRIAAS